MAGSGVAKLWMLTIRAEAFTPWLPPGVSHIKGQLEEGEGGFMHWQLFVGFRKAQRLSGVRKLFGNHHAEPTRSEAAEQYVWKEETRVEGTQFELGQRMRRNVDKDWDKIRSDAISGRLDDVPSDVYIRCYNSLKRIVADHLQPIEMERVVLVFFGRTGSGKSRRAWQEASLQAYPKDPRSKFWDGYRGQENVVLDEFRGGIDISHVLRWFDRYPVVVEVKGSSTVLCARRIWITSNIHPREWYPGLDESTVQALLRRLVITEFY
nr:MAG: replication associated protein [Cressdnaviricota sp.]